MNKIKPYIFSNEKHVQEVFFENFITMEREKVENMEDGFKFSSSEYKDGFVIDSGNKAIDDMFNSFCWREFPKVFFHTDNNAEHAICEYIKHLGYEERIKVVFKYNNYKVVGFSSFDHELEFAHFCLGRLKQKGERILACEEEA